jgi:hypothetical protein
MAKNFQVEINCMYEKEKPSESNYLLSSRNQYVKSI